MNWSLSPTRQSFPLRVLVATQTVVARALPLVISLPALGFAAGAEQSPPGDIPDTQVFIEYTAPQGFSLKVPEGWARSEQGQTVSFLDKLDGVVVSTVQADAAPTIASAKASYLPDLEKGERSVKVSAIKAVKLPAGPAIRITYTSDSRANAVTNTRVRLENERYLYFKDGKLVTLELFAPKGADNVDQWQLMSKSFRWN